MILFKILLGSNQDPVSNPVQNSTKFLHVQVPMLKIPQDSKDATGPEQSMKIDDRKINRSIDDNRLITVD